MFEKTLKIQVDFRYINVLGGTGECIFIDFWNYLNYSWTWGQWTTADISSRSYHVWVTSKIQVDFRFNTYLEGTGDCVLKIYEIASLFMFLRSENPLLTILLSYQVRSTSKIQVTFRFRKF